MNDQVPRHYRAFRLVLAGLVLGMLGCGVWYLVQPGSLDEILQLLRIDR